MGNQNGKGVRGSQLAPEDVKFLQCAYQRAGGSNTLPSQKLLEYWKELIDPHLVECFIKYMLNSTGTKCANTNITLELFAEPFIVAKRGSLEKKMQFIITSIAGELKQSICITLKQLDDYVCSVIRSYVMIQKVRECGRLLSWQKCNCCLANDSTAAYSKALLRSLGGDVGISVDLACLEHWLQSHPTFVTIWIDLITCLYDGNINSHGDQASMSTADILPQNEGVPSPISYKNILDIEHVIYINSNLPYGHRHKWRLLFSSYLFGESFSTLLGKIMNQGPTLLVVEDEDNFTFGGYAPSSWKLGANFIGDDSSLLFQLRPEMRCFDATAYNDHYQYLNVNQQTMPNGLGMGGQLHYWGLWIDSVYGVGQSSESCTTYRGYVQLSKCKNFRIKNLEVWGIGDEPKIDDDSDEEVGKKSVLNRNLEDRVVMELAGHTMHSDGLRESDSNF